MSKSLSLASNTTAATSPTASSIAMSRSSSSSSAPISPAEALALGGLKDVDLCQHKGIAQVLEAINLQSDKLVAGDSNQQYLVFHGVTQSDLAKIDGVRPKYTRVTYY
jgi:poly(3-hydroxybutyrate) depolymerase